MDTSMRRGIIGAIAGALSSGALAATGEHPFMSVFLGAGIGAAYSASLRPTRGAYVDNLRAAASLGVPLWTLGLDVGVERRADAAAFSSACRLGHLWRKIRPDDRLARVKTATRRSFMITWSSLLVPFRITSE